MRTYEQMIESLGRPTFDPAARTHFLKTAGAAYGLIFMVGFVALFWFPDAVQLQQASVHLAWIKLLLGLLTCTPIAVLVGWLAARSDRPLISVLGWAVGGAAIAWVAGHIPYEGVSLIVSLGDPFPTGRVTYPFSLQASGYMGITMLVGALLGGVAGLVYAVVADRAWERSTESHRLGRRSALVLCAGLPVAAVFGLYGDMVIHQPIRRPLTDVARAITTALNPANDLGKYGLAFLEPYRDQLTPQYKLYWISTRESYVQSNFGHNYLSTDVVHVVFDSGFMLSCTYLAGGDAYLSGGVAVCSPLILDLKKQS